MSPYPASSIQLRPATTEDLETILRQRREMFREIGGRGEALLQEFESASRRYFQRALEDGTYWRLFGEMGGLIICGGGVLIADWPGSPLNFEPKRAWILNIYVQPQHRRKGFARIITQGLIDWCRANGFQSVALHASEEGRRIYEKLGFHDTNEMRLVF